MLGRQIMYNQAIDIQVELKELTQLRFTQDPLKNAVTYFYAHIGISHD